MTNPKRIAKKRKQEARRQIREHNQLRLLQAKELETRKKTVKVKREILREDMNV